MDISDEAYELANKRGDEMKRAFASAIAAVHSPSLGQLKITFSSGRVLAVPLSAFPALAQAEGEQLSKVEISPSGFGIYFPDLDVDLYLPGLLEQFGQGNQ
jgi:hypothetical protein